MERLPLNTVLRHAGGPTGVAHGSGPAEPAAAQRAAATVPVRTPRRVAGAGVGGRAVGPVRPRPKPGPLGPRALARVRVRVPPMRPSGVSRLEPRLGVAMPGAILGVAGPPAPHARIAASEANGVRVVHFVRDCSCYTPRSALHGGPLRATVQRQLHPIATRKIRSS